MAMFNFDTIVCCCVGLACWCIGWSSRDEDFPISLFFGLVGLVFIVGGILLGAAE